MSTKSATIKTPQRHGATSIRELELTWNPSRISWGFEPGFARVSLQLHKEAGWLQMQAEEQGKKSNKKVFITFSKEDVERLVKFLTE